MDLTAQELMAKAMYNDWKSRERSLKDEWENVLPGMREVFMRKAEAALVGLQPMLVGIADDVDTGADVYSRLRMNGLLVGENGY